MTAASKENGEKTGDENRANDAPRAAFLGYPLAALTALTAALAQALGLFPSTTMDVDAVAFVNGAPVQRIEYTRALAAMQSDLSRPLTDDDRARALQVLIDEELMLQRALELGLARDDRLARRNLIQAMAAAASTPRIDATPDDDRLRAFFEQEKALFAAPATVTARIAASADKAAVAMFRDLLTNGADFDAAAGAAGLTPIPTPPGAPLGKIADYAGGSVRDAVTAMSPGDIAGPLPMGNRSAFVWLVERSGGAVDFEKVKDQVRAEWSRRESEDAFAAYLAQLRRSAKIRIQIDGEETPPSRTGVDAS